MALGFPVLVIDKLSMPNFGPAYGPAGFAGMLTLDQEVVTTAIHPIRLASESYP